MKNYNDLTLEERMIVYEKYQEEFKNDDSVETYDSFDEFDIDASWTNLSYDENLNAIG